MISGTEITTNHHKLSRLVLNKSVLYEILSEDYILLGINSHACTNEYLEEYTLDQQKIFTCEALGTHVYQSRYYTGNCLTLVSSLEKILKLKKMKPTGMSPLALPDDSWLIPVI